VAPIALYPDPLLAQTLAASTYPLEIIQLQQWMTRHPELKGEALAAAVEKENWDPAVQGLAGLPDVVAVPDVSTLQDVPWEPGVAHVIADVFNPDGSPNLDAMSAWLTDPNAVKLGAKMPDYNLKPSEIDALMAYLYSLK